MFKSLIASGCVAALCGLSAAQAYPLDGTDYSGIARLEGYQLAQEGKARARKLDSGALLGMDQVDIRLQYRPDLEIPPADKGLSRKIYDLLYPYRGKYSVALLDITDLENPVYAEHRADKMFNPGSVGKVAAVIALYAELEKHFPDPEARLNVLRNTQVTADDFIIKDHHVVPIWNGEKMRHRALRKGDVGSLATVVDWMMSASSNAAASLVLKEFMLLHYFGAEYPVSKARAKAFFTETKPRDLAELFKTAMDSNLQQQGIHTELFRQGGFFTRTGKARVPAGGSKGNVRELLSILLKLEKGQIIDDFSSREIKRLLYMTQKRIRYASAPALRDSAVYFKSGSLYRCKPEEGFSCKKYHGNVTNLLNSVAIVESPAGADKPLHYLVVVSSNILRKNAAVAHQTLATKIHRLLQDRHGIAR